MKGREPVIDALNELLTLELTVVNQYFVHSKMCESWGYRKLAAKFRADAIAEMKDAEEIIGRILFLEGVPNMQRLGTVALGETVREQLQLALDAEGAAVELIAGVMSVAEQAGDTGTREFLAPSLGEEEGHLDWLRAQIALIDSVGEQNYLAAQIRE